MTAKGTRRASSGTWGWPFSRADLTAGLRRHFGEHSLQVLEVHPMTISRRRPSVGVVQGLQVVYETQDLREGSIQLVVKQPQGTTRTGLAGAGRREVGVYQTLAGQLPLATPTMVAHSATGDWLLLEAVPTLRDAATWSQQDYKLAIESLALLHDRFWGLGEDLSAFRWLGRPLSADFEVHVTAAAHAIEKIVFLGEPEALAQNLDRMRVLARMTTHAEDVIRPLRNQPMTLLHGDYWPGNISIGKKGLQIVYDWQLTSVGPAVLDLLVFVQKSSWWFDALPMEMAEIISLYRASIAQRLNNHWSEAQWNLLWDHALMWRFLQEWLDLIAASPDPILEARAEQLDRVWLEPVLAAAKRRLGGV